MLCPKLLSKEEMEETAEVETSYKSSMLTSGADDLKFRLQPFSCKGIIMLHRIENFCRERLAFYSII